MKKIIKAITLFLIIAIFSEVSYAAEYLNSCLLYTSRCV